MGRAGLSTFPLLMFIITFMAILTFELEDETLKYDYSNVIYVLHGTRQLKMRPFQIKVIKQ